LSGFSGYSGSGVSGFSGASGISGYSGTASVLSISNDTSTATNVYPLAAAATSGSTSTVYTSNAKLLYKPSTGDLTSSQVLASNGLVLNNMTIGTSYTFPSGYSASSVGAITISTGVTVTVPTGSRWVVL
jgi:hypothetical protein